MFSKKRNSYSFYNPGRSGRSRTGKIIKYLVIFVIIYEIFTSLLLTTVKSETDGMNPSLLKNDFLIVMPVFYRNSFLKYIPIPGIREPERGDIVLYSPDSAKKLPWYLALPDSIYKIVTLQKKSLTDHTSFQNDRFIKRIIAVPGDVVSVKNNIIYVKQKGSEHFESEFELSNSEYNVTFSDYPENWIVRQNPFSGNFTEKKLGKDEYFLIGDNRDLTSDSRNTQPVKRVSIKGKVIFRYWPLKRIHAF